MSSRIRISCHNCGNNNNDRPREGSDNGGAGTHSTRPSNDCGITQIPLAVSNGGDDNAGISSSGGGAGVAGEGGNLVSARGELSSGVPNQNSGSSSCDGGDSPPSTSAGYEKNNCGHTAGRVTLCVQVCCIICPFSRPIYLSYHLLIIFRRRLHFCSCAFLQNDNMEGGVKDMEVEEVEKEVVVDGNENTGHTLINVAGIQRVDHKNRKNVPVKRISRVKYSQSVAKLNMYCRAASSKHVKRMQRMIRKKVIARGSNISSPKNEVPI